MNLIYQLNCQPKVDGLIFVNMKGTIYGNIIYQNR